MGMLHPRPRTGLGHEVSRSSRSAGCPGARVAVEALQTHLRPSSGFRRREQLVRSRKLSRHLHETKSRHYFFRLYSLQNFIL